MWCCWKNTEIPFPWWICEVAAMKILGLWMIVLFCGAIGISLAVEVGRRCERAQLLCRLGEQVRLLLDYSMTDTGAIFAQLASDPRFAPFGFLQGCDPAKTVTVATGLTARDDQELAAFLQRLGKSDLQNQLRLTDGPAG